MKKFILLPEINVINANAHSSPYTVGFPAMTAWLGFMHALQRNLAEFNPAERDDDGYGSLNFKAVAVSCHSFTMRYYKGAKDYNFSLIGTANPLRKDGQRPSLVEEPKCHLCVSLLIEYENMPEIETKKENIAEVLHRMKLAGGDIIDFGALELLNIEDFDQDFPRIQRRLMPGYVLTERRELMRDAMEQGADSLDAMLDYLSVEYALRPEKDDAEEANEESLADETEEPEEGLAEHEETVADSPSKKTKTVKKVWNGKRKTSGWIIPIAVGYQGISPLEEAANQRSPETPHRFAESVVTLGEFKLAYKIEKPSDMLWRYHVDLENNLYLCQQQEFTKTNP